MLIKNNTELSVFFSLINKDDQDFFKEHTVMGGNPGHIELLPGEAIENIDGMFKSLSVHMARNMAFEGKIYIFFEEIEV